MVRVRDGVQEPVKETLRVWPHETVAEELPAVQLRLETESEPVCDCVIDPFERLQLAE